MNSTRQFLRASLRSGVETGMVSAADVLRHVTPEVLASHLPPATIAKLIEASLAAAVMDAQLVLDTVGIDTLAEHVPTNVLWACLAEMAAKALGNKQPKTVSAAAVSAATTPAAVFNASLPASPAVKPQATVMPRPAPAPIPAPAPAPAPPPAPSSASAAPTSTSAPVGPPPAPGSKNPRRSDRRPARLKPRSATSSDFDVDTDVGEQWPSARGNGEAERLGAAPVSDDWQKPEETATKNVVDPTADRKS